MRIELLMIFRMLCLNVCICAGISAIAQTQTPNFVIILADDLGWSDVGYNHGANLYETPHIDRLAREGMQFNRFYIGAANCAPSRATFLTGCYGPRHGVYLPQGLARGAPTSKMRWKVPTQGEDESYHTFPVSINTVDPEFQSLAEVLKAAGYRSARLGKWHIGDDNQGFDVNSANGEPGFTTNKGGDEQRFYNDAHVAERLTDAGIEFIEENAQKPFFLYLSHWEVHTPLAARDPRVAYFEKKFQKHGRGDLDPVYAAEIEQIDISVGRVLECLERLDLDEETYVIFSSDNGGLSQITRNAPLRGGKGTYYEAGIRTPLCVWRPGTVPAGSTWNRSVHGVDLLPTFAELSGAALPTEQPIDGISLAPLWTGQTWEPAERHLFFHFPLYLGSGGSDKVLPAFDGTPNLWRAVPLTVVMKDEWKLIRYYEYDRLELFDLQHDPGERRNLAEEWPVVTEELLSKMDSWIRETGAPIPDVSNQ